MSLRGTVVFYESHVSKLLLVTPVRLVFLHKYDSDFSFTIPGCQSHCDIVLHLKLIYTKTKLELNPRQNQIHTD